ncbi:MAG: nitroreductase family deazaflavin-dependent oxidoreductase [Acidimicrobiales bacterium]|nr:nitroreductase family deazaflavin-dependent oxidoreductase [Acidimicrobiales bacterium]
MTGKPKAPRVPPRWFVTTAWKVHRGLYRLGGGTRFLWPPGGKRGWGALRLTSTGRRSGEPRSVILGYLEEGPTMFTLAMNGWGEGDPAWWLNLQAHPDATVRTVEGERPVRAREAQGEERDRLWARFAQVDEGLDQYAQRRATPTPVVVLEPR